MRMRVKSGEPETDAIVNVGVSVSVSVSMGWMEHDTRLADGTELTVSPTAPGHAV